MRPKEVKRKVIKQNESKMILKESDALALQKTLSSAVEEYLDPKKPDNVVGMGLGIKWTDGEPTGEPALITLVTNKLPEDQLTKANLVPPKLQGMQTDVLAVGFLVAGGEERFEAGIQTLAKRIRPAQGGYSVGHKNITAGTIGTCVYDILPGGTASPPVHGVGIPSKYYILSNNHVLANTNLGLIGDAVLQPGPLDGGVNPADRIATLSRFVPITLNPPVLLPLHNNLVDCAIAEGEFHDLSREIYWSGYVRGWRRKTGVTVGTTVKKTGRTTHFTTGKITVINATVDVSYPPKTGRFKDQIVTTLMSAPGDSGSLVLTLDNVAVGLLFAGSATTMVANQIENVRSLLRVEVAELIL